MTADQRARPSVRRLDPRHVSCVGETMALFTPDPPGPLGAARILSRSVAGAESNVAMYLARLGRPARWISRLGADPLGDAVLREVASAGVDVSAVTRDAVRPTGLLFKDIGPAATRVHYYRAGSAASAMGPDALVDSDVASAVALHLTGVTPALSDSCCAMVRSVLSGPDTERRRHIVSFDVNWRPQLWPDHAAAADLLHELARAADIVFVGLDEARVLWGCDSAESVGRLFRPERVVVVKQDGYGAAARVADRWTFVPSLQVDVVEPVGAGDAFAAGFLDAALSDDAPVRCLREGHLTAAAALLVTADVGDLLPEPERTRLIEADEAGWSAARVAAVPVEEGSNRERIRH